MPGVDEVARAVTGRLSPERAAHVARVATTATELARRHGMDAECAALAGWLHDWCREVPGPELVRLSREHGVAPAQGQALIVSALHGPLAARLLPQTWPDLPAVVLQAIDRHTTGDAGMTDLDCLIYVSDAIEPGRSYPGVDRLRALAAEDLRGATRGVMEAGLADLLRRGKPIDTRSVRAWNDLVVQQRSADREANRV